MSLVDRIKELCRSNKTTLIGLEREIELGRGTIRKWDDYSPSVDKLQKVAAFFKVSTEYLLMGFDKTILVNFINGIKGERSLETFSEDTGIHINELTKICLGHIFERPSLDIINRISNSSIDFATQSELDRGLLSRVAGYSAIDNIEDDSKDVPIKENRPSRSRELSTDIRGIIADLERHGSVVFEGKVLDYEARELLIISFESSMRLARKLVTRNFTPNRSK